MCCGSGDTGGSGFPGVPGKPDQLPVNGVFDGLAGFQVAEAAAEHGIPLKTVRISDKETAQNLPAPVTTYALFRDGKFVTHAIQSDKKFLALAGVKG